MLSRHVSRPRTSARVGAIAAVWLTSVAVATAAAATPGKDSFRGEILDTTGRLAGETGKVTVLLHLARSSEPVRKLQLTVVGAPCDDAKHCLRLSGVLAGTIATRAGGIPDVGRRYDLSLSGSLGTLRHVNVTGTLTGVGFIRQGRETLRLNLRTPHARLTITALSPEVPGFTSP
jgi:hypothetical protein